MRYIRTQRDLVEIRQQRPDLATSRLASLRSVEEDVKNPFGLYDDAEVGGVARLPFVVSGGKDGEKPGNSFKAKGPSARRRICWDVFRPRLRIVYSQTPEETPEAEVVVFHGAIFGGRRTYYY